MELFYIIVVAIALISLILFLTIIGVLMKNTSNTATYPPNLNQCPDYWTIGPKDTCVMPTKKSFTDNSIFLNTGKKSNGAVLSDPKIAPYSTNGNTFSTIDPLWTSKGETSICAQKNWALKNDIVWDGISNYNMCT